LLSNGATSALDIGAGKSKEEEEEEERSRRGFLEVLLDFDGEESKESRREMK